MSRLRVALLVGAVLAAAAPAVAQARAELDRSFYLDGTHRLPFFADDPTAPLALGGRVFVAANGGKVVQLGATGRTVTSYGRRGAASLGPAAPGAPILLPDPRPGDPRGLVAAGMFGDGTAALRLDSRGRIDPSWGTGGRLRLDGYVSASAVVGDPRVPGGLFLAGIVEPLSCPGCDLTLRVTRVDAGGHLDAAWGSGGIARIVIPRSGVLQFHQIKIGNGPDGSLTVLMASVVTDFVKDGRTTVSRVLRLASTGQPIVPAGGTDPFVPLGTAPGDLLPIADGAHGFFLAGRNTPYPRLWRVGPDGTPDPAFTAVLLPGLDAVTAVRTTPDGIVAAGTTHRLQGLRPRADLPRLLRLTSRGRPDAGFGPSGHVDVPFRSRDEPEISGLGEDEAGRLVVAASLHHAIWSRQDIETAHLGVLRVRTRPSDLGLAATVIRVGRGGVAAVRLHCSARAPGGCGAAGVAVRRGTIVLGRGRSRAIAAGRTATLRLRTEPRGRRLAVRRATVDIALTPKAVGVRRQETAPVLRAGRLAAG
jgi:hypothetical protein